MGNIDKHDLAVRLANLAYDYDYYDFMDSLNGDEDIETVILQNEKDLDNPKFIDSAIEWLEDEVIENINWLEDEGEIDERDRGLRKRANLLINDLLKFERENAMRHNRSEKKYMKEDTVKQGSHWVNKGKEGTHGKFKTKKAADAQRKAMFSQGYKESLDMRRRINESFKEMIDWDSLNFEIYDKLSDYLGESPEVYFEEPTPMSNGDTQVKFEILWGGDEDGFATVDIKGKMYGNPNIIHFVGKENSQKLVMEFDCRSVKEMINNISYYIEF